MKNKNYLKNINKTWLITGVAGFIGSNLLEFLLKNNQHVVGIDNFSTGFKENLEEIKSNLERSQWEKFTLITGDIRNFDDCLNVTNGVDYVLHQAALGSVPRSIENPILTNDNNLTGFLNILEASRIHGIKRFVFAASSSTYGDSKVLPKQENLIGKPLSPYAVTKLVNEIYADVFSRVYGVEYIGLRYFNVFGKRQSKNGPYSAVIPRWIDALLSGTEIEIFGDGKTSRDFCYIDNVIEANILSAITENEEAKNQIYNIAFGERTSLNNLYDLIFQSLQAIDSNIQFVKPLYSNFRPGDVRHSHADISKAKELLNYDPEIDLKNGLRETVKYYL